MYKLLLKDKFESLNQVTSFLIKENKTIATAESCTGGFISTCLTSKSGSSNYFNGSIVAYNNKIKNQVLNISTDTILNKGVVSKEVAESMSKNVLKKFNVDYGFSTTGYVDVFKYDGKKNTDLYAWISISSYLKTSSKLVEFSDDRLKNIFNVSNQIFKLFLKDFT